MYCIMRQSVKVVIPVSFRLEKSLVQRLRKASETAKHWPRPSQAEIVARGIELVLQELEHADAQPASRSASK